MYDLVGPFAVLLTTLYLAVVRREPTRARLVLHLGPITTILALLVYGLTFQRPAWLALAAWLVGALGVTIGTFTARPNHGPGAPTAVRQL